MLGNVPKPTVGVKAPKSSLSGPSHVGIQKASVALLRHEAKNATAQAPHLTHHTAQLGLASNLKQGKAKDLEHFFLYLFLFCNLFDHSRKNVGSKEGNQIKLRSSKKRIPARTAIRVCA